MLNLAKAVEALDENRFETARRICLSLIQESKETSEVYFIYHKALTKLGDLPNALKILDDIDVLNDEDKFQVHYLKCVDLLQLSESKYYRNSKEANQGLSIDEYKEKYKNLSKEYLEKVKELIKNDEHRKLIDSIEVKLTSKPVKTQESELIPKDAPKGASTISGYVLHENGQPATCIKLVLGLEVECNEENPQNYFKPVMGYVPEIGEQFSKEVMTDEQGYYCFKNLPQGKHEFIAACLDPLEDAIGVYFLEHNIKLGKQEDKTLNLKIENWESAEPKQIENTFKESISENGIFYQLIHCEEVKNPFYFNFPRQKISVELPSVSVYENSCFKVFCSESPSLEIPSQFRNGCLSFFAECPERSERVYGIYLAEQNSSTHDDTGVRLNESNHSIVLDTGVASFKLPWGEASSDRAPILSVKGDDNHWRGSGRWVLPNDIELVNRQSKVKVEGAVYVVVEHRYTLSNGKELIYEFTAEKGEALLKVKEISSPIEGLSFQFSLQEFSLGRGFLHWTSENGAVHWTTLTKENRELALLKESVAWWIPPEGFGYAVSKDSLKEQDYIGVVTLNRGEWVDRYFETICRGPGDENRELDWPFPEMVGSTVSMIRAHTSEEGDVWFHFGAFDGERQWGLLVSSFEKNDGHGKDISAIQHKNSSPRLQDYKDWSLDEKDQIERPFVLTKRSKLTELRKKELNPKFKPFRERLANWKTIGSDYDSFGSRGMDAMLSADPLKLWALKKEIAGTAHIRARMTLLGRDYADMYSPVGARPITPWAEIYDLIVITGVFTEEEECITRSCLKLMGYMYMECDLMNWKYGSRNANFEADRVDVVGGIGLAFYKSKDSDKMIQHCVDLMRSSLEVYCTPGSGKWYENPACYYLHASNCRLNLAFHLWQHGIYDVTKIPRLKDYLSWAIHICTSPYAHDNNLLRDGCSNEDYEKVKKVRRVPPIGDHAKLGQWFSEYFALMAKVYKKSDPDFSNKLNWLYQAGGSHGGYFFSRHALFYTNLTEDDLTSVQAPKLESRRLEGFGAVLRSNFNTENESYCIFKLGPGGYRYHRTEGSILLIENGKPLIFDGGEAGETWRHTTLSFGETHMPLAPGHVERFESNEFCDFTQGVNPVALQPGEPVFLSDTCQHTLVPLAKKRYEESNPVNSRSLLHVKGEYYILHDQLNLKENQLTHWHLQAVADDHSGDFKKGYIFKGRFGTDLQVIFPNQKFKSEEVRQDPILEYNLDPATLFSMRHLQLSASSPKQICAIIRPLHPGNKPVQAEMIEQDGGCVLKVFGENIDDIHFLNRNSFEYQDEKLAFVGKYGSVLRREGEVNMTKYDAQRLELF